MAKITRNLRRICEEYPSINNKNRDKINSNDEDIYTKRNNVKEHIMANSNVEEKSLSSKLMTNKRTSIYNKEFSMDEFMNDIIRLEDKDITLSEMRDSLENVCYYILTASHLKNKLIEVLHYQLRKYPVLVEDLQSLKLPLAGRLKILRCFTVKIDVNSVLKQLTDNYTNLNAENYRQIYLCYKRKLIYNDEFSNIRKKFLINRGFPKIEQDIKIECNMEDYNEEISQKNREARTFKEVGWIENLKNTFSIALEKLKKDKLDVISRFLVYNRNIKYKKNPKIVLGMNTIFTPDLDNLSSILSTLPNKFSHSPSNLYRFLCSLSPAIIKKFRDDFWKTPQSLILSSESVVGHAIFSDKLDDKFYFLLKIVGADICSDDIKNGNDDYLRFEDALMYFYAIFRYRKYMF